MNSSWYNLKPTYYVGKILGLFPFTQTYKNVSYLYSFILWFSLSILQIYIIFIVLHDHPLNNHVSKHPILVNILYIRIFFKFITAVVCTVFFAQRSKGFMKLIDKFNEYDSCTMQTQCPSNFKTQTFYLSYALIIEIYYFAITVYYSLVSVPTLVMWNLINAVIVLMTIQYAVFVRLLRERYKLTNDIFSRSLNVTTAYPQRMYPNEMASLYTRLRNLTAQVKNYFASYALLFITDSISVCFTCVTTLTLNYTTRITLPLLHNHLFFIYCLSKLLFLFFIVRETHNTIKETNKTVSIAHEALSFTTNNSVIKELEILIMTCWNHPIVFDVYDLFDLDYSLLQSIVAGIVTYVVVLVQIQLAISGTYAVNNV